MSWKLWATGEVVEASEFQSYLQNQVVQTYAGTAARSSALGTATTEGMISYLTDTNKLQFFDSSVWQDVVTAVSGTATALSGTIASTQVTGTAVTQADTATVTNTMLAGSIANDKLVNSIITMNGTAVSLGGSVTITAGSTSGMINPMTTQGDLIVGGAAGDPGRLGIGSANSLLSSDGTASVWLATASGVNTWLTTPSSANLAAAVTDETGSGALVFATSPSLTTPSLGVATATSINATVIPSSAGTVLTTTSTPSAPATATAASNFGYVGMPQVSTATGLSLSATHAGKHIYTTATGQTHTIPANGSTALEVGTTIVFVNPASVTTTIAITTDTLLLAGTGTTGSRTLAPYGMATALKIASTTWIISGNGLT